MSERKKIKEFHFQRRAGNSSTRASAQGDCEFGDVSIQPSVYEQLSEFCKGKGTEEEFKRQGGHYRKLLHQEQKQKFETIFVSIANARLPKDVFLQIKEEARSVWRKEYSDLVPPDFRHLKKIRKLRAAEERQRKRRDIEQPTN